VLFLPPGNAEGYGLVVAVVTGASDPGLDVARGIAAAARERLLVLAPMGCVMQGEASVRFLPGSSVQDVVAALGDIRERLIVMTRAGDTAAPDPGSALATARGVPVLVTEPG
jgi:hypothetical protein